MNDKYLLSLLEDKLVDTVLEYTAKVPRPFGLVFSGGFDSGLLAALTKPDHLFRVRFPYGTKFDETRYADAVIKHLGMERRVTEIVITPQNFKENFEDAVKTFGKTTTHFSLVPLYLMMKTIKDYGVKDVLSGEGPDEYLGGYARQIIFDELKKLYEIPELSNYHGMIDKVVGDDLVKKYIELMDYPKDGVYIDNNYELQGVLGRMDMDYGHIEEMEQTMAKKFEVNFHYPYINKDFAEFCYKLPDNLKIRNGVTKWGFRQIAMKYLPELLRDRAKMGGPVAPVNRLMGWDLSDFDKTKYIKEQEKILNEKNTHPSSE